MEKVKIEVISARMVNTSNGQRYVHKMAMRTDGDLFTFEQWEDHELKRGIYEGLPHFYSSNSGKSIGVGFRDLQPIAINPAKAANN